MPNTPHPAFQASADTSLANALANADLMGLCEQPAHTDAQAPTCAGEGWWGQAWALWQRSPQA